MVSFKIDRGTWNCGKGAGKLLTPEGKRCCLGFLGNACGIDDGTLLGRAYPATDSPLWPESLFNTDEVSLKSKDMGIYVPNKLWDNMHAIGMVNDERYVDSDVREKVLTEQFAILGIEVVFEDEYPDQEVITE